MCATRTQVSRDVENDLLGTFLNLDDGCTVPESLPKSEETVLLTERGAKKQTEHIALVSADGNSKKDFFTTTDRVITHL